MIESEGLLENARAQGAFLASELARLRERHAGIVSDTRGIGLIQGIEISRDGDESWELAGELSVACMERGLIVGGLRPGIREGNTLRLAPPLNVTADEIREAVAILDDALAAFA